jgi:hypothetical protein
VAQLGLVPTLAAFVSRSAFSTPPRFATDYFVPATLALFAGTHPLRTSDVERDQEASRKPSLRCYTGITYSIESRRKAQLSASRRQTRSPRFSLTAISPPRRRIADGATSSRYGVSRCSRCSRSLRDRHQKRNHRRYSEIKHRRSKLDRHFRVLGGPDPDRCLTRSCLGCGPSRSAPAPAPRPSSEKSARSPV